MDQRISEGLQGLFAFWGTGHHNRTLHHLAHGGRRGGVAFDLVGRHQGEFLCGWVLCIGRFDDAVLPGHFFAQLSTCLGQRIQKLNIADAWDVARRIVVVGVGSGQRVQIGAGDLLVLLPGAICGGVEGIEVLGAGGLVGILLVGKGGVDVEWGHRRGASSAHIGAHSCRQFILPPCNIGRFVGFPQ